MTTETSGPGWAPSVCTLPTAQRPLRVAEFDDLFATALLRVERLAPTRARLTLAGDDGSAATVADLTARETACCAFFAFTLTTGAPGSLHLDIEVPATRVDVLTALTARARALIAVDPV